MNIKEAQALLNKHEGNKSAAAREAGVTRTQFRTLLGEWTKGDKKVVVSVEQEELSIFEEHQLRQMNSRLRQENKEILCELDEVKSYNTFLDSIQGHSVKVPRWLAPKLGSGKERAIATAMLSDLHLDEVVKAEEMNYSNAYNRRIAEMRVQKFFENTIRIVRDYSGGVKIEGLVLILGGDMVSGDIHEELALSNEDYIIETVLHWVGHLAAGINLLRPHVDNLYVPCFVGNHGRMMQKPVHKGKVSRNFDYLIYRLLERECPDVTFDIPKTPAVRWSVYNTRYHGVHGDEFTGGGGIGGIMVPIRRGNAQKLSSEIAMGHPYDIMVIGHFHQLIFDSNIIVNGSLKGYDDYAIGKHFQYQPPQQAFWLTDPDHGITVRMPIRVQTTAEGWQRAA